ncbi:hypothetical protein BD779DRAFT_1673137 [Infundibulicybe gibba]|nr:hypothetical protein BD779DRAFT_1673137 [Infundibulicybe gibba]
MHFQKLALGSLVAALAALPSGARPAEASTDAALADGNLFVCTDPNFAGQCVNLAFFNGVCSTLPSGLQDNISSWGPDAGWVCITYTEDNCQGTSFAGSFPGFPTLPAGIDNAMNSYQCFRT